MVLCTEKCVKRVDLTLNVLTRKQTNKQTKKTHKQTLGSDGYVVMISRGLAHVQNDKFVHINPYVHSGSINYTSIRLLKILTCKYHNLGENVEFKTPYNNQS